jgi:perosamine synthetase
MIPIAKPLLGEEEKRAVLEVLESGMLAQGQKVAEFERNFAKFIGVKHAIATSNGTTALHATLLAHNIGPGDEVITSPFTFIATANSIKMVEAKPIFVDIDPSTFNIHPELIEGAITSKTKAIMPIHLYGQPASMDRIQEIAEKHNLIIIEDACQAHGAEFHGRKVGSFGTGCFSFYPTKNMTTGEGGMITSNDDSFTERVRKVIDHGSQKKYHHDSLGYNFRMTDLAAAIGIEQLKKLPGFNARRRKNAAFYLSNFNAPGIVLPRMIEGHVFHQYTIQLSPEFGKSRDELVGYLNETGIGCHVYYPLPLHKQEAFKENNQQSFPNAEKASQEVFSLPIHPEVSEMEQAFIIKEIVAFQRDIQDGKKLDGDSTNDNQRF